MACTWAACKVSNLTKIQDIYFDFSKDLVSTYQKIRSRIPYNLLTSAIKVGNCLDQPRMRQKHRFRYGVW